MDISALFPEINSWNHIYSVEISNPPRISKSKKRRLMKKARFRSRRVLEGNDEAGLMKGAPPLSARPSIAPPTPATDHQAVIEGLGFKEKTLLVADLVTDNQIPEKKRIAPASSDLVIGCPYDLRPRVK